MIKRRLLFASRCFVLAGSIRIALASSKKNRFGVACLLLMATPAVAQAAHESAVKRVAAQGVNISTNRGSGEIPLDATHDPDRVHPEVTRAVLVIHGKQRNVEGYFEAMKRAARAADARASTLILAPQFLNEVDVSAHRLGARFLHWNKGEWSAGEDAEGPASISSFDVVDQLLLQLLDKKRFPNLHTVVVAGHSGGGQFVQRYALVGRAPNVLKLNNIPVRFVVANPSSYFYFSDERPTPRGGVAPFADAVACKIFNRWRYGPHHAPPYAEGADFASLEPAYFAKDITYLLGTADTDPNHPDLDKSCAGEAQGPNRLARGQGFFHYTQLHHADPAHQRFWLVPGVGHDDSKMFNSDCGIAALFDFGVCQTPMP